MHFINKKTLKLVCYSFISFVVMFVLFWMIVLELVNIYILKYGKWEDYKYKDFYYQMYNITEDEMQTKINEYQK